MPDEEPKNWMGTLVNGVWSSTLPLLASPWAVREVVRLGYTWDAQWGEQLAEKVHAGRLLTRLEGNGFPRCSGGRHARTRLEVRAFSARPVPG